MKVAAPEPISASHTAPRRSAAPSPAGPSPLPLDALPATIRRTATYSGPLPPGGSRAHTGYYPAVMRHHPRTGSVPFCETAHILSPYAALNPARISAPATSATPIAHPVAVSHTAVAIVGSSPATCGGSFSQDCTARGSSSAPFRHADRGSPYITPRSHAAHVPNSLH